MLIDFEGAGKGPVCCDLIRGLYLLAHMKNPFHSRPEAEEFLAGYRNAGGLVDVDLIHELLPVFDLRAALWATTRGIVDERWAKEAEHRWAGLYIENGMLRGKKDYMWNDVE